MNRPERCAYLYARVKATMTLRTSGELQGTSGPRHRRLRLLALGAPGNTPVNVSNVPVGADVYRASIPSSTSTSKYTYVGTNAGPTTVYTDANTSTMGAALPEADNRVASGATGWAPFVPGVSTGNSVSNTAVSGSTPAIPSSCTGWTVDSSAGVTFPAGTWTFNRQLRPDAS